MTLTADQLKILATELAKQIRWPEIMDLETAGQYMDRTPKAVRHLIHEGKIPSVRLDGKVQVRKQDIDEAGERALM